LAKEKKVAVEEPKEEVKITAAKAWYGTGRRKTSIARVKLSLGGADVIVNGQPIDKYFPGASDKIAYEEPLKAVGRLGEMSASIKVEGSGKNSQLGAVVHGLARALVEYDGTLRPTLSRARLLRRDPRMKESKHFGLMGARKAKQSPKR
jgi:small subunit ribosomal protein S9